MDKEYLQHITASPFIDDGFVNEGFFDALNQRVRNVLPGTSAFRTPNYAKIIGHYDTFSTEVKKLLRDFSFGPTSVYKRLLRSNLTPSQETKAKLLFALYKNLSSSKLNMLAYNVTESLVGKIFSRLNGDPDKILNYYIRKLKHIYDEFISNLRYEFNGSSDVLNKFKSTINDLKKYNLVASTKNVIDRLSPPPINNRPVVGSQATSSIAPPTIPQQSSTGSLNSPVTSSLGQTNQTIKNNPDDFTTILFHALTVLCNRVQADKKSFSPYINKPLINGGFYLPKKWEEPDITGDKWKTPVTASNAPIPGEKGFEKKDLAYKADLAKYNKKLSSYPYTSDFEYDPSSIKETTTSTNPAKQDDDDDEEHDEEALSGKFLYDLGGRFRKYPKYSLELTSDAGEEIQLSNRSLTIRVFLNWDQSANFLIVKYRNVNDNNWTEAPLLKFYDDQANPRSSQYEGISIPLFLSQVDPDAKTLFQRSTNKTQVLSLSTGILPPVLYSIVKRKSMEYKSYKELAFFIDPQWKLNKNNPYFGGVRIERGRIANKTRNTNLTLDELLNMFFIEDGEFSDEIENALQKSKYFEQYSEHDPDFQTEFMQAKAKKESEIQLSTIATPPVVAPTTVQTSPTSTKTSKPKQPPKTSSAPTSTPVSNPSSSASLNPLLKGVSVKPIKLKVVNGNQAVEWKGNVLTMQDAFQKLYSSKKDQSFIDDVKASKYVNFFKNEYEKASKNTNELISIKEFINPLQKWNYL